MVAIPVNKLGPIPMSTKYLLRQFHLAYESTIYQQERVVVSTFLISKPCLQAMLMVWGNLYGPDPRK